MTQYNTPAPVNFVTGMTYKGDKVKILQEAAATKGFTSNEWATMNQWNKVKRSIARGEHGTAITYTRILESEDGPVEILDTAWVYNREQLARVRKDDQQA